MVFSAGRRRRSGLVAALVVLLGAFVSTTAKAQQPTTPAPSPVAAVVSAPDFSSPEATVRTFTNALTTNDYKTALFCVKDAQSDELSKADVADTAGRPFRLQIETAKVETMGETSATVRVTFAIIAKTGSEKYTLPDTLRLEKTDGPQAWKIVALTESEFEKLPESEKYSRMLAVGAATMRTPAILRQMLAEQSAYSSVGNVKLLSLAALTYAQANKNSFVGLTMQNYVDVLLPFHRDKSIYTCLQDKPGTISFQFNGNLSGKTIAGAKDASRTVLFYEGEIGEPLFRYAKNTKAIVGTLDGYSRLVTKEEAVKLLWTP